MTRLAMLVACALVAFAAAAEAQGDAAIQTLNEKWGAAFNKGDAAAMAAMYRRGRLCAAAGRRHGQGPRGDREFLGRARPSNWATAN